MYETIPSPTEQTQILVCEYTPEKSDVPVEAEVDPVKVENLPEPVIRGGLVTRLDVLMPDEYVLYILSIPMRYSLVSSSRDLRLTLTNDIRLPEPSWPTELLDLISNRTS